MLRTSNASAVSMAVTMIIAAQAGMAQDAAPGAGDRLVLDEIVVSARKRDETLIDVPLTVTAVSAAQIEELGIRDSRDLALYTPGFSNVASFGRNSTERPVIRGQSNILGDPNASYFVDGVYLSGSASNTETANLERIEVIKGPQAALYGRATFAGAINYVTRRPTETFEGRVNLTAGEFGQRDATAFASGPIIDGKLYYFVAGTHTEIAGFYDNPLDSRDDLGAEQTDAATVKLLWTPLEGLEVTGLVTYSEDQDAPPALGLQGRQFNNCQLRSAALPRSRGYYCGEVFSPDGLTVQQRTDLFPEPGTRRERTRAALTVKYEFADGYEFTSASGYSVEDYGVQIDVSYAGYDAFIGLDSPTAPPPAAGAAGDLTRQFRNAGAFWRIQEENRNDFSQELRLRSPSDRAFRWTIGAFYFDQSDDFTRDDKAFPDGRIVPNGAAAITLRQVENQAIFAGVEYDFTDQWTATAEFRHAEEDKEQLAFAYPTNGTARVASDALNGTWKSDKPRFTLRYKMNEDVSFFANYAEGNKPGGFNAAVVAPLLSALGRGLDYDEEESSNYEVGAKFRFLDRRAFATVTLFDTELSNQQLTQNIAGQNAAGQVILNSYIDNVGKTQSKGLELEVTARLTERFDLSFGGAYVDAKIKQYVNVDQADLYSNRPAAVFNPVSATNPTGCTSVAACQAIRDLDNNEFGSVAGQRAPRAPEWNGFLLGKYTYPLANGLAFTVGGDVVYEGSKFAQIHNLAETGARTYLNARIGLESDNWSVQLWGRNLNDDDTGLDILRYIDSRGIPGPAGLATRAFAVTLPRPRQLGITGTYRF
jgi:outer membrane receptor protein involved in Fe transport